MIMEAELWGVFMGLFIAWDEGCREVILECDSWDAVILIQKPILVSHPPYNLIIDCKEAIEENWRCEVTHIYREKNASADHMADLGYGDAKLLYIVYRLWRGSKKQMKSKNMEKNKIEKRKGGEDYVQFRCNMMSFLNTMQRVKKHLTERHLELLQQTPFWPLISAFYSGVILEDQCKKSDNDVRTIIKCYNSGTMSFEFGSKSASLTTKDIAEILGLPQEGEEVQLKGTQKHISDFTRRYFEEEIILYKKLVDNALEKALKGKRETDVGDVVHLIVLELCGTFLLCTSHAIFWNLVKYCEDLEKITRYSWAKAVADLLHEALGKQTRGCKPCSIPGCVIVIMLWLCEKTNLIQPINGREGHKPALVKWRVRELHSKLNEIDVTDIGLSFKKDKKKKNKNDEMEKPLEEAKIDGQDLEEGENVLDDTAALSECAFRAQKTQSKLLPVRTLSKRLIHKDDLEKRREDLGEMIQNASAEVAKAQGKVNRLTEKLESKNDKIKNLKRKLKEEKEEKRKMKEDYEFLIAEQKSLLESVKRFVKNLEGALKAKREEVKHLKKDKMEMIKEIQELKDQLNEGSPCTALQGIQIEVCPKQLFFTSLDKNRVKRASDPEFEYEQEGKKKRKVGE